MLNQNGVKIIGVKLHEGLLLVSYDVGDEGR